MQGSTPSALRGRHERLILHAVRRRGEVSRVSLAAETGLSAQTVGSITRALIDAGYLDEGDRQRGRVGQPATPLSLAAGGAFFLGLKVGRRRAELVLVDFAGNVRAETRRDDPYPHPDRMIEFARAEALRLLAELTDGERARLIGMGVAIPFNLWDWGAEMAVWRGRDLRSELEQVTGLPVWLENDASCACAAELIFGGSDAMPPDFLHLYLAHFAGGGLVLDGRLRLGPGRNAGAVGSIPLAVGIEGAEGGAQVLDRAGVWRLERALGHIVPADDAAWDGIPAHLLQRWIDDCAVALAQAAIAAVAVADLSRVVVDGAMPAPRVAELATAVETAMGRLPTAGIALPPVSAGTMGRRARVMGAAALPLSAAFLPDGSFSAPRLGG